MMELVCIPYHNFLVILRDKPGSEIAVTACVRAFHDSNIGYRGWI